MLTGTGYMCAHVAVNNAIGKVAPADRATDAFSAMALAFSMSGLVGPLVSGFGIDHGGYSIAFLLLDAFALASCFLLRRAVRRYPVAPVPARAHASARIADLLRHEPLRPVFVVSGLLSMGWDLFNLFAPLHGVRAGLSATATAVVVGSFGVGTFAIRLLLPWISRRTGQWTAMAGALFLTAIGYVAFPLLHDVGPLLAAAFLLGMSLGCGQPMSMALLHHNAPARRWGCARAS